MKFFEGYPKRSAVSCLIPRFHLVIFSEPSPSNLPTAIVDYKCWYLDVFTIFYGYIYIIKYIIIILYNSNNNNKQYYIILFIIYICIYVYIIYYIYYIIYIYYNIIYII